MRFSSIIGQNSVKEKLVSLVLQNRLSHALLFLGKEGVGSLSLAMALAQYLLCEKVKRGLNPVVEDSLFGSSTPEVDFSKLQDSCGECAACIKAEQLAHPDIHFSYPVVPRKAGDKPVSTDYISEWRSFVQEQPYGNAYDWLQFIGAENKQGNITAAECNEIIRKLNLKSFESGFKVLILWLPEYLGNEGNKLLKLIEEPPADTLFILVAENESLILQTILSRTQLVKIPALEAADMAISLEKDHQLSQEIAQQIASFSNGNFREALHLLKEGEHDWQGLLRDWLNAILKNGPIAQVQWIDEISKLGREKQKQFLRYFTHLLEQAIRIQALGTENVFLPEQEKDFSIRLNKIAGFEQQEAIIKVLDDTAYHIERNANTKMLFHAVTIKIYHILALKQTTIII